MRVHWNSRIMPRPVGARVSEGLRRQAIREMQSLIAAGIEETEACERARRPILRRVSPRNPVPPPGTASWAWS